VRFTFSVDISGMQRRFAALGDALTGDKLNEALLRTGGVVRARIKKDVFGTEGAGRWPALDPETQKRKYNEHMVALLHNNGRGAGRGSMVDTIANAAKRAGRSEAAEWATRKRIAQLQARSRKTEKSEASLAKAQSRLESVIGAGRDQQQTIHGFLNLAIAANIGRAATRNAQGRFRRRMALTDSDVIAFAERERERRKKHSAALRAAREMPLVGNEEWRTSRTKGKDGKIKTFRYVANASEERKRQMRVGARRYNAAESSTRMLGGLENSITMRLIDGKRIEVFSKARIGAIHNFGGTAGHGARIPQREFMYLADSDLDFLANLLREQGVAAWIEAA